MDLVIKSIDFCIKEFLRNYGLDYLKNFASRIFFFFLQMNLCEKAQINFLKKIYMTIDKGQLIYKLLNDMELPEFCAIKL